MKGSTTAEVTRPAVRVDWVRDTGRAAWAENCRIACAASGADMASAVELVLVLVGECFAVQKGGSWIQIFDSI